MHIYFYFIILLNIMLLIQLYYSLFILFDCGNIRSGNTGPCLVVPKRSNEIHEYNCTYSL